MSLNFYRLPPEEVSESTQRLWQESETRAATDPNGIAMAQRRGEAFTDWANSGLKGSDDITDSRTADLTRKFSVSPTFGGEIVRAFCERNPAWSYTNPPITIFTRALARWRELSDIEALDERSEDNEGWGAW